MLRKLVSNDTSFIESIKSFCVSKVPLAIAPSIFNLVSPKQGTSILLRLLEKGEITQAVNTVNDKLFNENPAAFKAVELLLEKDLKKGLELLSGIMQKKLSIPDYRINRFPARQIDELLNNLLYTEYYKNKQDLSIFSQKLLNIYDNYNLQVDKYYYAAFLDLYLNHSLNSLKLLSAYCGELNEAGNRFVPLLDREYERFRTELSNRKPLFAIRSKEDGLTMFETLGKIVYFLKKANFWNKLATKQTDHINESLKIMASNTKRQIRLALKK